MTFLAKQTYKKTSSREIFLLIQTKFFFLICLELLHVNHSVFSETFSRVISALRPVFLLPPGKMSVTTMMQIEKHQYIELDKIQIWLSDRVF